MSEIENGFNSENSLRGFDFGKIPTNPVGFIEPTEEEEKRRQKLHEQFLNDSFINTCLDSMMKLYQTAVPKIIVNYQTKTIQNSLDVRSTELINQLETELNNYINKTYLS